MMRVRAGELRIGSQLARHREPVHAGQSEVEEHEIRPQPPRKLGRAEPVARLVHLVSRALEPSGDHGDSVSVVIDQQNLARYVCQGFTPSGFGMRP